MDKKFIWIGVAVIAAVVFLIWLFTESSKPLPGQKMPDLGRDHIETGKEVEYNSNPPTSGDHYPDWVRAGVYSEPKDDRNLVHSLEHGYVVMSYKCTPSVIASTSTTLSINSVKQSTQSGEIATDSSSPRNDGVGECDSRKAQLEGIYNKKGKKKLIVVPRPNLDTNFALTAWTYLEKYDEFDSQRIEKFIDAHLNNGPERTME